MALVRFLRWTLRCDPEETRRIYLRLAAGPETCACEPCLNFAAARSRLYPAAVLSLLDQLGIDHTRETEVMHFARLASGLHSYAGWFHLIGEIVEGGECWRVVEPGTRTLELEKVTGRFSLGFSSDRAIADPAFASHRVVQLEFSVDAPWVLSSPEPD
jgi:hypothetical protein